MSVKMTSAMPKADHNGLAGQEERIERLEGELVPLVVMCEVAEIGRVVATDEATIKLRMAEVEIVDREKAEEILRAARKARTGVEELDFSGFEGEESNDDDDN